MTTPIRVLVVDDSAFVRKVVTEMLNRSDAVEVVGFARDGEEALELVERLHPDVITLDLVMPRMNGVEFLRALRQRPLHRDTPVVIATSERDDSSLMQEVSQLGVAAIVKKPWKPQALASVVAQACSGRSPPIDGI